MEMSYSRDRIKEVSRRRTTIQFHLMVLVYRTDTVGCIPGILDIWFNQRVEFKNEMKKYGKAGDKEKYAFYHKRQLVQKILLNSLIWCTWSSCIPIL
jgi:hypothetical protein